MTRFSRSARTRLAAVAVMVAAAVGAGGYLAGVTGGLTAETNATQTHAPAISPSDPQVQHANTLSEAFRQSAEKVLPAVVSIHNEVRPRTVQSRARPNQDGDRGNGRGRRMPREFEELDPFLKKFFEDVPDLGGGGFEQMPSVPQQSSGSGVIIDPAGVILTNNHVVAGGGKLTVRLHDGREYVATEVKTDPNTDVAVLRIKADGSLPFATLGDSDRLQIGDWVLALGQPFGLQDTVTAGIISAKGRAIGMMRHEEFLQTDAAINPGNSGGPLVNLQGEVIGINTAISSRGGGFEGIGFAVPANVAKWVSSQLVKDGKVQRAYLGVGIQPLDQELADQLGVKTPGGALVTDVQPDSPAASGGLKSQDVIVEFNGTPIANHRQLSAVVSRTTVGKAVPVTVVRDGKQVKLHVTVKQQPPNYGEWTEEPSEQEAPAEGQQFNKLGLEVAPLSDEVARQLGMKESAGVVITGVDPDSVAGRAGLEPSMAIVQVGRQSVKSVTDFEAAIGKASLDKGVLLLVRSAEGSRFVVLKSQ